MGQVNIVTAGDRCGIWIGNDTGVLGLEAIEHVGIVLVKYPPGTRLPLPSEGGGPPQPPPCPCGGCPAHPHPRCHP